jgi:3-phenylpropionate/trans-cinnamate dioxygenase ferredoxin subunit
MVASSAISISLKLQTKETHMSDPTIQVLPKGPYLVAGKITLLDASGNKIEAGEKIALCRCGASTNKPFCDGTHSKIGFDAAAAAVPQSAE